MVLTTTEVRKGGEFFGIRRTRMAPTNLGKTSQLPANTLGVLAFFGGGNW